MDTPDEAHIRQAVVRAEETGKLAGLVVEYWQGGGPPPPLYHSAQLRLLDRDGADSASFANQIYDRKYTPPVVHEVWTMALSAEEIRHLMRLLVESRVLEKPLIPHALGPADSLVTEINVSLEGGRIARKYGQPPPDGLPKLEEALDGLIARVKEKSPRVLYHQDKKID